MRILDTRWGAGRRPLALLCLLSTIAACGGGGSPLTFADCGNGIVDSGEECDDGPGIAHSRDNDSCLSTCKLARCGDGFVDQGVEACDLNNLNECAPGSFCTCGDLGYAAGQLRCDSLCTYDVSGCGPSLPTPTVTPTVTATASATATFTPLAGRCGNGVREFDETCDDGNLDDNDECPSDCRLRPCTPAASRVAATVVFAAPSASLPRSVTVLISYPDEAVGLPDGSERSRIAPKGGVALTLERDFQHALRVRLNRTQGVSSGDVFAVSFDGCQDVATPPVSEFSCSVLACDGASPCTCSVELR